MNPVARIVAVIVMANVFAPVAEAAMIRGSATFEVEWLGDEEQGKFDPPLLGSGSFEIRSRPYDPDVVSEVSAFEVLDFSFSFAGASWDESDLTEGGFFIFTPDGQPDIISFDFNNGDASGFLIWSFEGFVGGDFGMDFVIGSLAGSGSAENGQAGSAIDSSFVVVPEPGSLGLLALGLVGLRLSRQRRA